MNRVDIPVLELTFRLVKTKLERSVGLRPVTENKLSINTEELFTIQLSNPNS